MRITDERCEVRLAVWREAPWLPRRPAAVHDTYAEQLWRWWVVYAYEDVWEQALCGVDEMDERELHARPAPEPPGPDWHYVAENTHRMRVEGGWLYKHERTNIGTVQPPATIVFVKDAT